MKNHIKKELLLLSFVFFPALSSIYAAEQSTESKGFKIVEPKDGITFINNCDVTEMHVQVCEGDDPFKCENKLIPKSVRDIFSLVGDPKKPHAVRSISFTSGELLKPCYGFMGDTVEASGKGLKCICKTTKGAK